MLLYRRICEGLNLVERVREKFQQPYKEVV